MADILHPNRFSLGRAHDYPDMHVKLYKEHEIWNSDELHSTIRRIRYQRIGYVSPVMLIYYDDNIHTIIYGIDTKIKDNSIVISGSEGASYYDYAKTYIYSLDGRLLKIVSPTYELIYNQIKLRSKSHILYHERTANVLEIGIIDDINAIPLLRLYTFQNMSVKRCIIPLFPMIFINLEGKKIKYQRKRRLIRRQKRLSLNHRFELIRLILKDYNDLILANIDPYEIYSVMRNIETMLRSKLVQNPLYDANVLPLINSYF